MASGVPDESNETADVLNENGFLLQPVEPRSGGEGLPYAPVNWPNPGDNWRWRAGTRVSRGGYFFDRYMYLPKTLLNSSPETKVFRSKPSLEEYIRKKFPSKSLDDFFASFSWKILAESQCWQTKGKHAPRHNTQVELEKEGEREGNKKGSRKRRGEPAWTPPAFYRRRTRHSCKQLFSPYPRGCSIANDLDSIGAKTASSDSVSNDEKSETDGLVHIQEISVSSAKNSSVFCLPSVEYKNDVMGAPQQELATGEIPEDFDAYLNNLEDTLFLPFVEVHGPPVNPSMEELDDARRKLSSLLAMDFPVLFTSHDFEELSTLAAKLQKDPGLSADQLAMLRLIQEIPLTSKDFIDARNTIEQASQFFADLEKKVSNVTSLKDEYLASKEKATQIESELNSNSLALKGIVNQIVDLQSRRDQLAYELDIKKKEAADIASAKTKVATTILQAVREIQVDNSRREEWQEKKENAAKRETEIRKKFAHVQGFSF